jgi:enoyl-[acyl-carrier protein] reductase II
MNRVTKILGITYPIIQAPMTWVTSAELAAAVSNAGGLGVLGPNVGETELTTDPAETGERLRRQIAKTRTLTDKPFGVNLLVTQNEETDAFTEAIIQVLIQEKIQIIAIVGIGEPNVKKIKALKEHGFILTYRQLFPSVEGAKVAEEAGVDIIVATGFDAGGATPLTPVGTMIIVPLLVDAVNIPVMAAGGIADRRTVNASFALGAEGVYLGTRFLASEEARVTASTKQNIVKLSTSDMVLYPTAYSFQRSSPNKLALELKEMEANGASGADIDLKSTAHGGYNKGMLQGDLELGIDTFSNSVGLIREVKSCKAIIDDLMADVHQHAIPQQIRF